MYKDKITLAQKYNELGSLQKVADYFGVSKKLILNYMNRHGIARNTPNSCKQRKDRNKNNNYHKGYIITDSGYKLVKCNNHPKADSKGYVREHILVVEDSIGRNLKDNEVVHHVDRNRLNNDINNLVLMDKEEHRSLHSREPRKVIDIYKAVDMLYKGYTMQQVAVYFSISESGLRKKIKSENIELNLKRGGARRKIFNDL